MDHTKKGGDIPEEISRIKGKKAIQYFYYELEPMASIIVYT